MGTVATVTKPSTTNNLGHAAGLLVGGIASKWLVAAPFVLKLAEWPVLALLGLTPMSIAALGGAVVATAVSYGVTHVAELREAAKFAVAIGAIKVDDTYPTGKNGDIERAPLAQGQDNANINKGTP